MRTRWAACRVDASVPAVLSAGRHTEARKFGQRRFSVAETESEPVDRAIGAVERVLLDDESLIKDERLRRLDAAVIRETPVHGLPQDLKQTALVEERTRKHRQLIALDAALAPDHGCASGRSSVGNAPAFALHGTHQRLSSRLVDRIDEECDVRLGSQRCRV